jgi:hypothetical protein
MTPGYFRLAEKYGADIELVPCTPAPDLPAMRLRVVKGGKS